MGANDLLGMVSFDRAWNLEKVCLTGSSLGTKKAVLANVPPISTLKILRDGITDGNENRLSIVTFII